MDNDIEGMKAVLDNVVTQLSIITVKQNVFHSMVLDIYGETLPSENAKMIYTNFVNVLEKELTDALNQLDDCLFDSGHFLLRQKTDLFASMQQMKRDERYMNDSND